MELRKFIKTTIREYLNEQQGNIDLSEFYKKFKNDVINSNNFKEFSGKAVLYPINEKEIVENFLSFVLDPYNNHNRNGRTILYHGSPDKIEKFKLTKGVRSGGIFGYREVENLGVFLTDEKKIAKFFGNNRADRGYSEIYTVFVDLGNVLDFEKLPPDIKKLGNYLLRRWQGKRYDISRDNFWLLLDMPDFVNEVKKKYDTIIFKEAKKTFKAINVSSGYTYFIIDPKNIEIYNPLTYDELKGNINYYITNFKRNQR